MGQVHNFHGMSDFVILIGNTSFHGKGLATEAILLGKSMTFSEH